MKTSAFPATLGKPLTRKPEHSPQLSRVPLSVAVCEIRKRFCGHQWQTTRWTRQWSLHYRALKYRLGGQGKSPNKTAALHRHLTCGSYNFISKGKTPSAIQNFPEGYIIIGQVEALWFYPGEQVQKYTQSKHTIKPGRTILAHTSAYQKTGVLGF